MADVFERTEKKYLLTARQRADLEAALQRYMKPDAHGESTIRNIYYDTLDYRLIRRSLEKPVYKEKLRVRSYRRVTGTDEVFVELKKKYKGVVYKRRIAMKERQAMYYLENPDRTAGKNQICRELDYFCRYYQNLRPSVFLCYDRVAYFGKDNSGLRISFDKNIRFRTQDMRLTSEAGGRPILTEGQSLMEIKAAGALPVWLVQLLSAVKIRPVSFSKYGQAYQMMLAEGSIAFIRQTAAVQNIAAAQGFAQKKGVAYA